MPFQTFTSSLVVIVSKNYPNLSIKLGSNLFKGIVLSLYISLSSISAGYGKVTNFLRQN